MKLKNPFSAFHPYPKISSSLNSVKSLCSVEGTAIDNILIVVRTMQRVIFVRLHVNVFLDLGHLVPHHWCPHGGLSWTTKDSYQATDGHGPCPGPVARPGTRKKCTWVDGTPRSRTTPRSPSWSRPSLPPHYSITGTTTSPRASFATTRHLAATVRSDRRVAPRGPSCNV